jgi:hypothetical protein
LSNHSTIKALQATAAEEKPDLIAPRLPTGPTPRADLTEQAAAEFVRRHGRAALAILGERAETAEELGHRVAATAWREMETAAAHLLGTDDADVELPRPPAPVAGHRRPAR